MAAVSQDISSILWNQEMYYSAHNSPPSNACPESDIMFLSTPKSAKGYLFIISSVTDFKEDGKNDVM
jgi:hypothetical protein